MIDKKYWFFGLLVTIFLLCILLIVLHSPIRHGFNLFPERPQLEFEHRLQREIAMIGDNPENLEHVSDAFMRQMALFRVPIEMLTCHVNLDDINAPKIWNVNAHLLILILQKLGLHHPYQQLNRRDAHLLIRELYTTDPSVLTLREREVLMGALGQFALSGVYFQMSPDDKQRVVYYYDKVRSCDLG